MVSNIKKNLVIVESPAKAKTIGKFLGNDFEIMSSQGHICDLPKNEIGIDIENDFKPKYQLNPDKKKTVSELKKISKKCDFIYLASDDDREGEAISWHLKNILELEESKIKRIVFHEITEKAIKNAVENPRDINMNLVNSQQTRRILDRLVGYKVSQILWKKIKHGLSAGRVQSVAVKLIVEKEREILKYKPKFSFRTVAEFKSKDKNFKTELKKDIDKKKDVIEFMKNLDVDSFYVKNVEKKKSIKSPLPPFTTSTLQQEASVKLEFGVSKTMLIAQHLYENGKISYMRTDSVILSEDAITQARETIIKNYGEKYVKNRQFKTNDKLAQEAHEAIRPTHFSDELVSENKDEQKLYALIRNRALASQMADAELNKTTLTIGSRKNDDLVFIAKGETIEFDGFLKLYVVEKNIEEEDNEILPNVVEGDNLNLINIVSTEKKSHGPSRYSEASLVKELEKKGIGRPSTYAPIISIIQVRGYVVKESRGGIKRDVNIIKFENNKIEEIVENKTEGSEKNKLFPTDIAMVTNDFLVERFHEITNYDFTANIEKKLDKIADGKNDWIKVLHEFYDSFSEQLNKCVDNQRVEFKCRELGIEKKSGKKIYARLAKFGPVLQIGEKTATENPKYIALLKNQNVETITLEEALKLIDLPKFLGKYNGEDVFVNNGKFGPFVKCKNIYATIPNVSRIFDLTLDEAIELLKKKNEYIKNGNTQKNTNKAKNV